MLQNSLYCFVLANHKALLPNLSESWYIWNWTIQQQPADNVNMIAGSTRQEGVRLVHPHPIQFMNLLKKKLKRKGIWTYLHSVLKILTIFNWFYIGRGQIVPSELNPALMLTLHNSWPNFKNSANWDCCPLVQIETENAGKKIEEDSEREWMFPPIFASCPIHCLFNLNHY